MSTWLMLCSTKYFQSFLHCIDFKFLFSSNYCFDATKISLRIARFFIKTIKKIITFYKNYRFFIFLTVFERNYNEVNKFFYIFAPTNV